jgi:hypothetical protein
VAWQEEEVWVWVGDHTPRQDLHVGVYRRELPGACSEREGEEQIGSRRYSNVWQR